jgi:hypothetical protein
MKLFGRSRDQEAIAVACPHTALSARWDTIADMGKQDKISSYVCTACGKVLTPAEAVSA